MGATVSIGNQSFEAMRQEKTFYIDKTAFIKEWWESKDTVTLITRPRRFGKTLNISMMECFFSTKYANRKDLFEGLFIWEDETYRTLQGTWPVISFSFAEIKGKTYDDTRESIITVLQNLYEKHSYLLQGDILNKYEKKNYRTLGQYVEKNPIKEITDTTIAQAVKNLMKFMVRYFGSKVIVLLDEYDTPMQEAYVSGFWPELTALLRSMFNAAFKTNEYIYRALLTGITRVSKESIFSDLNHIKIVTTTTDQYCTSFGFTEEEVFQALKDHNLAAEMNDVKFWYDGFIFGNKTGIYNPWSITNYLDSGKYGTYWADSSSNALVSELLRTGTPELKMQMETLLSGKSLEVILDEQVIFEQLRRKKGAIWSLLVASGYLKPEEITFNHTLSKDIYRLKITNHETMLMFRETISEWFPEDETAYGNFKEALLTGDLDYMNQYMNEISEEMFSTFDAGRKASKKQQPERFYHGFVLGLIVDLAGRYHIRSNRESGLGRYDILMEPIRDTDDAIIIEFKVFSKQKDGTLKKAAENALAQIDRMKYDTELNARGIPKNRIRHYGFVFDGKTVFIRQ